MTSEGWLFIFEHWKSSSVDLLVVSPEGTIARYLDIDAAREEIEILESAHTQGVLKASSPKAGAQQKGIVSDFLRWGGAAFSLGGCILTTASAITATAGTGGLAFPTLGAVALACGSAGVSIGNLFWATDQSRDLGNALSVVRCVTGSCTGLGIKVVTRISEVLEESGVKAAAQMSRDSDADGIPDVRDNCPTMFNPAPQLDTDGDGTGDQCDPTPFGGNNPPTNSSCSTPGGQNCAIDYEANNNRALIQHGPGTCENTGTEPGPSLETYQVSLPSTVAPNQSVTFSITWNRCSDCNPNAVIYSSLIGDWAPASPLYVSGAYFTNCAQNANDTVVFTAPNQPGTYKVRWILCFAFKAIKSFCGEHAPGSSSDPGVCPFVEATFTVCP